MFKCNGRYEDDLKEYNEKILEKYGVTGQASEREMMCMADEGNTVALKLYADMIFYKKILRKNYYRDAFELYMKAAGMTVDEEGNWECSGDSYPLSFWGIGYYLVNYKRESVLKNCETIEIIENMTLGERMKLALQMAVHCLDFESAAGAINLVGRILYEASKNEELFNILQPVIQKNVIDHEFVEVEFEISECNSMKDAAELAETFFISAAQEGYVFACNSLASKEAGRIISMKKEYDKASAGKAEEENSKLPEDISESIMNYICFLKLAADKYEPYAANRLGLFYATGEIISGEDKVAFRDYIDYSLAKEYFLKATVYPDSNSAWAYFNLMKFFPKMYDRDIELMNEHMDYIKVLNPKVYDDAMEL